MAQWISLAADVLLIHLVSAHLQTDTTLRPRSLSFNLSALRLIFPLERRPTLMLQGAVNGANNGTD